MSSGEQIEPRACGKVGGGGIGGCSDLAGHANSAIGTDRQQTAGAGLSDGTAHICNDTEIEGRSRNGYGHCPGPDEPAANTERCLQIECQRSRCES